MGHEVRDTTGKGSQATAPRQGCQSSATPAGVGFSGMHSGGGDRFAVLPPGYGAFIPSGWPMACVNLNRKCSALIRLGPADTMGQGQQHIGFRQRTDQAPLPRIIEHGQALAVVPRKNFE